MFSDAEIAEVYESQIDERGLDLHPEDHKVYSDFRVTIGVHTQAIRGDDEWRSKAAKALIQSRTDPATGRLFTKRQRQSMDLREAFVRMFERDRREAGHPETTAKRATS